MVLLVFPVKLKPELYKLQLYVIALPSPARGPALMCPREC